MFYPYWVFKNEELFTILRKYVDVSDEIKGRAVTFLKNLAGLSPIDGLMFLLSETSGIFLINTESYDDYDIHTYSINLFSNFPEICPFYWESENLLLFDDWIVDVLKGFSSNEDEQQQLYSILEWLIYDIIGTLHSPVLPNNSTSMSSEVSVMYIREEAIVFSLPYVEESWMIT